MLTWHVEAFALHFFASLRNNDQPTWPCSRCRWAGWPHRGRRVGEADTPGPRAPASKEVVVASANVTAWRSALPAVAAARADVWCWQEARIDREDDAAVTAAVKEHGYVPVSA